LIYFFYAIRRRLRRVFSARRAFGIGGAAATIIITGTVFFYLTEPVLPDGTKNSLFNSLYWVVETVSTVGYGDIVPTNLYAKLVFFYVIIFGLGTFAAALTELGGYIAEKRLLQLHGFRHSKLKEHIVIVGYNESAKELIQRLRDSDADYVLVVNTSSTEELRSEGINFIAGDMLLSSTLRRAGIERSDALVLCLDQDEEAVMVALKAREIRKDMRIIATCARYEDYSIMKDAGIDIVIPSSKYQGDMLADAVLDAYSVDLLFGLISGKGSLELGEMVVERESKLSELSIPSGSRIIAVRSGSNYTVDLNDGLLLRKGDIVFFLKEKPRK
jgi:voltage-gated potassium channel